MPELTLTERVGILEESQQAQDILIANLELIPGPVGPQGSVVVNGLPVSYVVLNDLSAAVANRTAINAALALSNAREVNLPEGTIYIDSAIFGQNYRHLKGQGRGRTILKATLDFAYVGGGADVNNAIVMVKSKTGMRVTDLTVDASKVGNGGTRLNGIRFEDCVDFGGERLAAKDISGYSFFSVGLASGLNLTCRNGNWVDLISENANIHFEVARCENVRLDGMRYSAGDGDINNEAAVHPLDEGRLLSVRNVSGADRGGLNLVVSDGRWDRITVSDCSFYSTTGKALVVEGQGQFFDLTISDCWFESATQDGTDIGNGSVANRGYVRATNTTFKGKSANTPVTGVNAGAAVNLTLVNCLVWGECSSNGHTASGISNASGTAVPVMVIGGEIRASVSNGAVGLPVGSLGVIYSGNTIITGGNIAQLMNPLERCRRVGQATFIADPGSSGDSKCTLTIQPEPQNVDRCQLIITPLGNAQPPVGGGLPRVLYTQGSAFVDVRVRGDWAGISFNYVHIEHMPV